MIDGFDMPVEGNHDGKIQVLYPTDIKKIPIKNLIINVHDDYYILKYNQTGRFKFMYKILAKIVYYDIIF